MRSRQLTLISALGAFAVLGIAVALFSQGQSPQESAPRRALRAPGNISRTGALMNPGKLGRLVQNTGDQAPTDDVCRAVLGIPCYSPQEIWNAYGVTSLIDAGYTGVGQTIVIIDSFGSPTIASDLHTFDVGYGLPDPPSFQVLAPLGTVPFDPTDPAQLSWAGETTLDVEWAHALAPGANIVLLTSPVAETQGVPGMPEFLELEQYALDHHLGKIISQSWATPENDLFASAAGIQVLANFENFFKRAAKEDVTVLAGAGDTGNTGIELDTVSFFPTPVVNFPASSPWVTAVGGTSLYATSEGHYIAETVWNDASGAGGGGVSQYFAEPRYQKSLPQQDQIVLNGFRGIPDIAYNADCNTAILFYVSYLPAPDPPGFYTVCGTSEGSPQWAGIIADANQFAGSPLGFLNEKLYNLGANGQLGNAVHDVFLSDNTFVLGGYLATPGWDLATGWGTPDAGKLVRALVQGQDQ
jgi:subtilase family serine protease